MGRPSRPLRQHSPPKRSEQGAEVRGGRSLPASRAMCRPALPRARGGTQPRLYLSGASPGAPPRSLPPRVPRSNLSTGPPSLRRRAPAATPRRARWASARRPRAHRDARNSCRRAATASPRAASFRGVGAAAG